MTSVSSYYNLSGQQAALSGGSGGSSTASLIQSLTNALQSAQDPAQSQDSSNPDAFLLDLSPTAQQLLGTGSSATAATGNSTGTSSGFTLSAAQENTIKGILEKYKNAPFNQATFDQIQNDLETAGLGPDQLAAQNQISSFSPTSVLLDALNGNYSDPTDPGTSAATQQSNETSYMQGIIGAWQSVSTTYSASAGSSSAASS